MVSTRSSSGRNTWRNAASPVTSLLCILSSAITSSRMSRSAGPLCTSTASPVSRSRSTGLEIPLRSRTQIPARSSRLSIFVGVMTYSQYPYVEAFMDEKQRAWIAAHVHTCMSTSAALPASWSRITAMHCSGSITTSWYNQELNAVYQEMAEHYSTAIIPARVRAPKDKPNAEGSCGQSSQPGLLQLFAMSSSFRSAELNQAIRQETGRISPNRPFQKKEGSRYEIFRDEELPLLAKLPATPYELAEWKQATVQFNYHISC